MIITDDIHPTVICVSKIETTDRIDDDVKYDEHYISNLSDIIYRRCQKDMADFYLTKDNFEMIDEEIVIPCSTWGNFKEIFNNSYANEVDTFISKVNSIRDTYGVPLFQRTIATKEELTKVLNSEDIQKKIRDKMIEAIKENLVFRININDI